MCRHDGVSGVTRIDWSPSLRYSRVRGKPPGGSRPRGAERSEGSLDAQALPHNEMPERRTRSASSSTCRPPRRWQRSWQATAIRSRRRLATARQDEGRHVGGRGFCQPAPPRTYDALAGLVPCCLSHADVTQESDAQPVEIRARFHRAIHRIKRRRNHASNFTLSNRGESDPRRALGQSRARGPGSISPRLLY